MIQPDQFDASYPVYPSLREQAEEVRDALSRVLLNGYYAAFAELPADYRFIVDDPRGHIPVGEFLVGNIGFSLGNTVSNPRVNRDGRELRFRADNLIAIVPVPETLS